MSSDKTVMCEGEYLRLVRRGHWEYAERTNAGSAVIVIAVTPEQKLLFVEQYRIPMGANTIEMPAGLVGDLEATDTMEEAARRELLEETGWLASEVKVLMVGPSSSGMSNELVAFVRARGLTRVHAGGGDETEDITVHEVAVADAPRWLVAKMAEGYAMDPKLWAGLWLLDRNPDGSPA
ncbi:NUDIX hydrolase [Arenimonas caeni]|jgi:ADP-ribose pyrophosphatase|uniref:GDP-mannose pyrophosphatase n=1 Tax=Arenimonas caeni TaxID=2058085 RepID=A0A2P6M6B2_9GAMM|nr:NUDIX hydrolase [Arenimonas caeni]MDY0021113.1 NUDIX hydrolase [Arenimonas caeni]PRH81546.1 DNA mismatch repair protein MutT [Arenimonas caeni]